MGVGTIFIVLTLLLGLLAWRTMLYSNKDLARARARTELARRSSRYRSSKGGG